MLVNNFEKALTLLNNFLDDWAGARIAQEKTIVHGLTHKNILQYENEKKKKLVQYEQLMEANRVVLDAPYDHYVRKGKEDESKYDSYDEVRKDYLDMFNNFWNMGYGKKLSAFPTPDMKKQQESQLLERFKYEIGEDFVFKQHSGVTETIRVHGYQPGSKEYEREKQKWFKLMVTSINKLKKLYDSVSPGEFKEFKDTAIQNFNRIWGKG